MPLSVVELKSTDRVETSLLGGPDRRVRILKVIATGPEAATFKPADALSLETFPKKGDAHPDDPTLILQSITGEYDDGSNTAAIYTLTYTWPQMGSLSFPTHLYHRLTVRVGAEARRVFLDANGEEIGSLHYTGIVDSQGQDVAPAGPTELFRPDSELGAMMRFPRVQLDLELAGLQPWNPLWTAWVGSVNSEPMPIFGAAPGMIEYVGVDGQQARDSFGNVDKFRVTLHFIGGLLTLKGPDGADVVLNIDEVYDARFKKVVNNEAERVQIGEVLDADASKVRQVKARRDLNALIP